MEAPLTKARPSKLPFREMCKGLTACHVLDHHPSFLQGELSPLLSLNIVYLKLHRSAIVSGYLSLRESLLIL